MPESKPRKRTASVAQQTSATQAYKPNPVWFKPVMFGLMIIGLLWIITFYISEGSLPGQGVGVVEHRGRIRHRHRRLPDDHALAFLTPILTGRTRAIRLLPAAPIRRRLDGRKLGPCPAKDAR